MYHAVTDVKPMADFRLLLTFDNDERRVYDVRPLLSRGVFSQLKNPALFNEVRVSFDTVEWPNGADLCPETLYSDSVPATQADLATV